MGALESECPSHSCTNRTTKADVPAAPASKRKGSSGRQQLNPTVTLPRAARLATTVLLESDLAVA
jgi:hypothetical protein